MVKFNEVCETKKFLPRIQGMMKGHGLLYSRREIDKIEYDGLEFQKELKDEEDKFSYAIGVFFNFEGMNVSKTIESLLKNVMSNGYVFVYLPHRHYYKIDKDSMNGFIPHDILIGLKQLDDVMFEIVDFQTFPYEGSYGSKDPEKVEYSFQIIMKKSNKVFSKKDLNDDKGQLISLDD
jgi:hypothetical protein